MKLTNKCMSLDNISVEEFQLISPMKVYRDWVTEQDARHIFPTKALFEAQKHFLATNYPHAVFSPGTFAYLCSQITSTSSFRLPGSNNKSCQSIGSFLLLLIGKVFYSRSAEPSGSRSCINSCLEDYLYSNKYVAIYA